MIHSLNGLVSYEDYISHHGILGQKWGKRNGPPYPLGSEQKSKAEKIANNSKDKKFSSISKSKGLTDTQKKLLIAGASVIGVAALTYGAVRLSQTDAIKDLLSSGKKSLDPVVEQFGSSVLDLDDDLTSPLELEFNKREGWISGSPSEMGLLLDLRNVNPNGGKSNCVACVITEYLRSHCGYDVIAKDRGCQYLISEVKAVFPDFDYKKFSGASSKVELSNIVKKELLSYGDGATGLIGGKYSNDVLSILKSRGIEDTGHAFKWTVCGDRLVFTDGQNKLIGEDIFVKMMRMCDLDGFSYGRLDGLKIDKDLINIFCENRG